MNYFICEIAGRQYMVQPGQVIEVNKLKEEKKLACDKVLLKVTDGKVQIGKPYLKETVEFEVIETVKKPKIRVAKYSAKANSRTVTGQRAQMTRIKIAEEKKAEKKAEKEV